MKKIAVAGTGMMGEIHIASLRSLGLDVYAIIGRDRDKTEKDARRLNVKEALTDFEDAIKLGLDAIHICTPPKEHANLAKKALLNNMHVICEKPFTFSEKEGKELVNIAKEKNLINAVGFNMRFHDALISAEEMISSGSIGDVLLLNGSYMQEFHALPSPYSWRSQDWQFLATTEIGSHFIDLMRYLTKKEILGVSALYKTFYPKRILKDGMQYKIGEKEGEEIEVKTDNVAIVSFLLSDDAIASMTLSEITQGRKNYLELTITGSNGSIWFDSEDLSHLRIGKKGHDVAEKVFPFSNGFNGSVASMLKDIYEEIDGRSNEKRRYATFSDGLANTKVCNAIYNSAHNNSKWEML